MDNTEIARDIAKSCQLVYGSKDETGFKECYDSALKMAEWKDNNPNPDVIKKIISYALKNTNIMIAEDLENGVNWELLIYYALK